VGDLVDVVTLAAGSSRRVFGSLLKVPRRGGFSLVLRAGHRGSEAVERTLDAAELVYVPASVARDLSNIDRAVQDGTMTHTEARRRRTRAIASSLQSPILHLAGRVRAPSTTGATRSTTGGGESTTGGAAPARARYLEFLVSDGNNPVRRRPDGTLYNGRNDRTLVVGPDGSVRYADTSRPCRQCDPSYELVDGRWRRRPDAEHPEELRRLREAVEAEAARERSGAVREPDLETSRQWRKASAKTMDQMREEASAFEGIWNAVARPHDVAFIEDVLQGRTGRLRARDTNWATDVLEILQAGTPEARERAGRRVARELYNLHRNRFWNAVRNNAEARAYLESAGWRVGESGVPVNRFTGEQLTLEHSTRVVDDPRRALAADNLMFSPRSENVTLLEQLRALERSQVREHGGRFE
jgi:hypothetical protein